MKISYIYILSNTYRTTFYIGMTSKLKQRVTQHQLREGSKFASKYSLTDLVYYEEFSEITQAILREKQLKNWKHDWKINLIKELDPTLKTLDL